VKLAKERDKLRSIQTAANAAQAEVQRLDDALADHFAQEEADPEPTALLGERAVALERRDQPWQARIAGQRRKVAKLESLRESFAASNAGALLAEIEPEARDAAESLGECSKSALDGLDRYEQIASKVMRIVSADPRMNGQSVPTLGQEGQELRRALKLLTTNPVPPPLPSLEEADPTITSPVGTVTDLAEGE
jgi:hypothetical protein